jgi:transposase-like protein
MKIVRCPHCNAEYESYGYAEHPRCESCHRIFEVDVEDVTESKVHKIIERIDGLWNDEAKDAK